VTRTVRATGLDEGPLISGPDGCRRSVLRRYRRRPGPCGL